MTNSEKTLLFIAATQADKGALNFCHMALPFVSSPVRMKLAHILEARPGEGPPDLMAVEGVDFASLLGHELDGPAYLAAERAYSVVRLARLEKRAQNIASTLSEAKETPALERIALAQEECQAALSEMGAPVQRILTVEEMWERYEAREKQARGISVGLGEIDAAIRGVTPGQVMTIGGKAGVGKTALALHMLRKICAERHGLFFSIEMPAADIWERLAQAYFEESHQRVSNLTMLDKMNMTEVQEAYPGLRVVDVDTLTLDKLRQFIRMEKQAGRADVVFIDYLQRMSGEGRGLYEMTSNLARGIKSVAKAQDVPVVLLSQLSREAEDKTTPVQLYMFRDSGQIEEAADYVVGVWREGEDLVGKGLKLRRGGENCKVRFEARLETMTLVEK